LGVGQRKKPALRRAGLGNTVISKRIIGFDNAPCVTLLESLLSWKHWNRPADYRFTLRSHDAFGIVNAFQERWRPLLNRFTLQSHDAFGIVNAFQERWRPSLESIHFAIA
jgi:hypothetical protein